MRLHRLAPVTTLPEKPWGDASTPGTGSWVTSSVSIEQGGRLLPLKPIVRDTCIHCIQDIAHGHIYPFGPGAGAAA